MFLFFTFEPLPGKSAVEYDVYKEEVTNKDGFTTTWVHRHNGILGKLIAAEVVSCGCVVWGKKHDCYTAFDLSTTPPTLLRRDFALSDLRKHGAKLPEFYFDELGNLRGNNDELVMAGPGSNL